MTIRWDIREHLTLGAFLLKWLAISIPSGAMVGTAVAFFLWSLDRVTEIQCQYSWLLYLLPVAGVISGYLYHRLGQSAEAGNNLIMEQIHEPGGGVPTRMAPLVLIGTLITHLFGGSAGREGTAVQMGGSIVATLGRWMKLNDGDMRILLTSGIAAGFGAVFGTPLTGAIFAIEVLTFGRMNYQALIPCLIASIAGDQVNTAWGVGHTAYEIAWAAEQARSQLGIAFDGLLAGKVAIAAVGFGLVSVLFAQLTHGIVWAFKRTVQISWLRPAVGGVIVILLTLALGHRDYLGLGVNPNPGTPNAVTIQSCFLIGGAAMFSWWWKLVFTAVTVGSGFKGGEVTPLFFIGAALGNVLGSALAAPVDLMAALGFVAVFAGATNTPLACTIMAIELFGHSSGTLLNAGFIVYAAIACFVSWLVSGRSSIYHAQRIGDVAGTK